MPLFGEIFFIANISRIFQFAKMVFGKQLNEVEEKRHYRIPFPGAKHIQQEQEYAKKIYVLFRHC